VIRSGLFAACGIVMLAACGCVSTRAPSVVRHRFTTPHTARADRPQSEWALDNLRPSESTVLVDGQTVPISIDMKVSGTSQYALTMSACRKTFHPFLIRTWQGLGEIQFSGTVTWFLDVRGTCENVTVALYRIENSDSGKTKVKTLVKEIRREYPVVCDENEWPIMLALKKLLGLCRCG
jgi:hypothetical protein